MNTLIVEYKSGQAREAELIGLFKQVGFKIEPSLDRSYDFTLFYVQSDGNIRRVTCDLKVQYTSYETFIVETHSQTTNQSGDGVKPKYETSVLRYHYDFLVIWHLAQNKLFFISRPELEQFIRSKPQLPTRLSRVNYNPSVKAFYRTTNIVIHPNEIRHLIMLELDLNDPHWSDSVGCFLRS